MKGHGWRSLGSLLFLFVFTLVSATGCSPPEPPPPTPPSPPVPATDTQCLADASWVSSPNPPQEIPGGGEDFCDFYQFAWQWFLYLGSPSGTPGERNFQVAADFPELMASGDSCTTQPDGPTLFVRAAKSMDDSAPFVLPERIGQAGGGATIYSQDGVVVFYNIRFDRGMCDVQPNGDFPAGTTELKTSWQVVRPDRSDAYLTMEATIEGVSSEPVLLGLVGLHLFRTTADHPEGVWATWEHASNAPDCIEPQAAGDWSFTSSPCAECLANLTEDCFTGCAFNQAEKGTSLLGTPTEICRVYRDGSAEGDNKSGENFRAVDALNEQLVGPDGILTRLAAEDPMAVWKNYFNVGGLWVSNPQDPATSDNQRGSLQLANTTMETAHQGALTFGNGQLERGQAANCFACHDYTPGSTTTGLSHIFDDIHGSSD